MQSIRSRGGSRPVWLMQTLPAQAAPADYLRAIADAAAGGGRWVLALSDELRHGLRTNQADAMATWRQIGDLPEIPAGARRVVGLSAPGRVPGSCRTAPGQRAGTRQA